VVSKEPIKYERDSQLEVILQEKSLSSIDLEHIVNNFVRNGCKNEQSLIDFKETFEDSPKHWLDLCKDIVAANNSGGSLLIFGINNDGSIKGCESKAEKLFDPSRIQDKLNKYIYLDEIQVECTMVNYQGSNLYGLRIRPTGHLIIFDKSGQYDNKGKPRVVFREGVLYVRSHSESRPASQAELNQIIENMTLQRVRDLLAKIEKVAYAPQGSAISIVPPGKSEMRLAVKLEPTNPEALPIKPILDEEPFTDAVQEATAQLKTWKSNHEHKVEKSLLSKWYLSSDKPEWNEDLSIFCLHSALYTGGFTHYWAANLSKINLEKVIITEIRLDNFRAFKSIAYLIPSFFWNERISILDHMNQITKHISMRNLIPRLAKFDNIKNYKRRARLYNGNLKLEGKQVNFSKLTFEDARDVFRRIQAKESKCLLNSQERLLGHQLDIFLHTPSIGLNESGNFLGKLENWEYADNIQHTAILDEVDFEEPEGNAGAVTERLDEMKDEN
jgi:hypothetical protein